MAPRIGHPSNPSTARSVGPYRLLGLLGRGGMGEVFKAYDDRLDRHVAIKHIRPESLDDPRSAERFRREARTVARLSHPAIIQIFDLIEEDDGDWIVMEYLEGETLAERLRRGPVPMDRCLPWAMDMASGLAAAHAQGIVHRDLKPSNVFVVDDGRLEILDFGLAKRFETQRAEGDLESTADEASISLPGALVGTGSAMSPEQARGRPIDHRSDLFSLGTLLYRMSTGISPFRGETLADTLGQILQHDPPPPHTLNPSVPVEFSNLVGWLHEKSPDLRPASAHTVVEHLRAITAGSSAQLGDGSEGSLPTIAPPSPGTSPSAESRSRRFRPLHGLVALVLLGLLAVAVQSLRRPATVPASGSDPAETTRPMSPQELYRQGSRLLQRYDQADNIDGAIAAFQTILGSNPNSAPAYAGLAQAHWWRFFDRNRDPTLLVQAEAAAQRAVELDEHFADARYSRGLVRFERGLLDAATTDFQAALTLDPSHAGAHSGQAKVFQAEGKIQEAEAALQRAIQHAPEDRRYYDMLGALHIQTGRYREAEEAFTRSVELAPDAHFGRRNLAATYHLQGRFIEASRETQAALEIRPTPSLYSNLGALLFIQGLYADASTAFEKALELGDAANDYRYWANLADAYRWHPTRSAEALTHYARAIQLLGEELERHPNNPTSRSRLALYRAKADQCPDALDTADTLAPIGDLDAYSHYRLAVTYEVCGQRQRALQTLFAALERGFSRDEVRLDPELTDLRSDVDYHRRLAQLPAPPP